MESNYSPIREFYKNKSVFITGATGFLGKTIIEKLVRSCTDLNKIYILIRHKKGKTPTERLNDILNCQLFDIVRKIDPNYTDKLHAIEGDLLHANLGISDHDLKLLVDNVNIVIHSAATVRFDEPLRVAVQMNIIGTKRVIELCKDLKHLKAFVHVSTAYANCDRSNIGEEVYKPPIDPNKLIEMLDLIDDNLANYISPIIIKPKPNTYTYTKAIAESLVVQESIVGNGHGPLPTCIVRPSIITASWREPFPGWIDNFNGPTALFPATGTGMLRSMLGYNDSIADIIPVDITVNLILASAWYTATKGARLCHASPSSAVVTSSGVVTTGSCKQQHSSPIPVFNCTSGQINKFTWGMLEEIGNDCVLKNPFENVIILPNPRFTSYKAIKYVRTLFEQLVPAYIMDFFLKLFRRKPLFVRLQLKIKKAVEILEYFTTKEWVFTNDNIFMLMKELNEVDSQLFNFDIRPMQWRTYIEQYWLGTKIYLMKEDISRINYCRRKIIKMKRIKMVAMYSFTAIIFRYLLMKSTNFKQFLTFLLDFGVTFVKMIMKYFQV